VNLPQTGALNGRLPSAMQNDLFGKYKLIFSDVEEQSFVFPSPSSIPCPWLLFRNSLDSYPLCAHACLVCYNKTSWVQDEVCECVEGAFSKEQKTGEACRECPAPGGVCKGNTNLPYPDDGIWGNTSSPLKFFELWSPNVSEATISRSTKGSAAICAREQHQDTCR